ncbi:MAG: HDIG domain-containing protein [Clostridiales bacterium]|nr:HDIG domain-containing protein [Clostridiales bacterium]
MKSNRTSLGVILPLVSAGLMVHLEVLRTGYGVSVIKLGILTLILTLAATYYVRLFDSDIIKSKIEILILAICYMGSLSLLFLVNNPEIEVFWMIGGLLVSMIVDRKLGLFLQFNLVFIYAVGFSGRIEAILHLILIGALLCALSKYLMDKSTLVYGTIIVLSTNITLAFVLNNFIFEYPTGYDYIASLINNFIVIIGSFFLSGLYNLYFNKKENMNADLINNSAEILSNDDKLTNDDKLPNNEELTIDEENVSGTNYDLLKDINNDLLGQLKEYSQDLYEHAQIVADISGRGAKVISADETLAYTGGLYHEIGKIRPGNYIDQGLLIADEYHFPEKLKTIVKQHNIKYDKPTSVEAAIVMLTDLALSTIDYIENHGNHDYPIDKIIGNIFQMRLEKGTFDESCLNIKDFKILREFYQEEFHKRGIKE